MIINYLKFFLVSLTYQHPDYNLDVGSATPCIQIAEMISKLEHLFHSLKIDIVLVYGDTNSTFAGALSSNKINDKCSTCRIWFTKFL